MGSAALKRRGLPAAIAWHEHEHFPRGRVVYMTDTDLFTVYADRKLQTPALLGEIVHGSAWSSSPSSRAPTLTTAAAPGSHRSGCELPFA